MKYFVLVLVILYGASFATSNGDEKWTWGFVNEEKMVEEQKIKTTYDPRKPTTPRLNYDPCERYNPEKPSFKAPWKRISEEKCEELVWDMRLKDEQQRRQIECEIKNSEPNRAVPEIIGGMTILDARKYPHMGALGWMTSKGDYVFKCGGTLISSKFVLTAAHCTRAPIDDIVIDSHPKIVRLSQPFLYYTDGLTDENIIRIIVHEYYQPPKKYYDIALLELKNYVVFNTYLKPACLWTQHDVSQLGPEATITGWGILRFGSRKTSESLQSANVNIIDSEQCDRFLNSSRNKNFWGLMEHQLCAGKLAGGVDACQGDSGGPLQVPKYTSRKDGTVLFYVVGVTSFGIGCAHPNLPGIYTRVSSFIDWIEKHVWK